MTPSRPNAKARGNVRSERPPKDAQTRSGRGGELTAEQARRMSAQAQRTSSSTSPAVPSAKATAAPKTVARRRAAGTARATGAQARATGAQARAASARSTPQRTSTTAASATRRAASQSKTPATKRGSAVVFASGANYLLPWTPNTDETRFFIRLLKGCVGTVLAFALIIPFLPMPEVERSELEELPPQLARIVIDKVEPPPPPPPPEPEPEPEPEIKQEEPEPEPEPPKPEPEPEPPKPEPKLEVEPEPTLEDARDKAQESGLLAFSDAFADMRDAVDVSSLTDTSTLSQGAGEAATIDRSVLTSKHGTRSAGVNVTELSRDTGGVALAGRQTTKVVAPKTPEGTSGARKKPRDKNADRAIPERSIEDVRRVFDANKGAIFAIYNRALRKDPTLQGKVVLELVIDPQGRVTDCKVVASEVTDEAVVAKIVNRVRLFNFGQRNVAVTRINYPVHFLPS